jgi:hypothetical protein
MDEYFDKLSNFKIFNGVSRKPGMKYRIFHGE